MVNSEAEKVVLGSLLVNNSTRKMILGALAAEDFFESRHRTIYQAIQHSVAAYGAVDVVAVHAAALVLTPKDISMDYLLLLSRDFSTRKDVFSYVGTIKSMSALRKLYKTTTETADLILNGEKRNVSQLVKEIVESLDSISEAYNRGATQTTTTADALNNIVQVINWRSKSPNTLIGLPTGFAKLDEITSGLQGGELTVIAGRPSMGKTAFAMNIVEHVLLKGKKSVMVFSLEMSRSQLLTRMIGSVGMVKLKAIKTGKLSSDDWLNVREAAKTIGSAGIIIDDSSNLTPSDIRSKVAGCRIGYGQPGLIVIDYIQLMGSTLSGENRAAEISGISRSLRNLAKELNVPIIIISQLNRSLEQRIDKRPIMADLKESGAIEQDADVILFVYREESYSPTVKNKGKAEIIIGKHRNGPTGSVSLSYLGEYTKFQDI